MDKIILHLPFYDITLETDISYPSGIEVPSSRQVKVFGGDSFKELNNRFLGKMHLFSLEIDERNYNTIRAIGLLRDIPIAKTLIDKFNEFKKSDVSYGDFQSPDVGTDSIGYYGSKALYVEDFFDFLKIENRDLLISNILENE